GLSLSRFAGSSEATLRCLRPAAADGRNRLATCGRLLRVRQSCGHRPQSDEIPERRRQELDDEPHDRARVAVCIIDWRRMKHTAFVLLAAMAALAAEKGPDFKLPPPFATPSSTNRPRVIPKPAGASLHVPDGFKVEMYAEGFEQPRYMTLGPSNEILLSDSKAGVVWILQPQRKKLIEKLDRPYGLA